MPCKRIIVIITWHIKADEFWDVWDALLLKHSLNVFLALRKFYTWHKRFCFLIIILQFEEL